MDKNDVTGVILAGGRGSRMGGADKGLQNFRGMPLALQTLMRLAPQVGPMMINANRNLAAYESFGVEVWPVHTVQFSNHTGYGAWRGPLIARRGRRRGGLPRGPGHPHEQGRQGEPRRRPQAGERQPLIDPPPVRPLHRRRNCPHARARDLHRPLNAGLRFSMKARLPSW